MRSLRVFRRVAGYYREHLLATVVGSVAAVASALVGLIAPSLVRRAIDDLTRGAPFSRIWTLAAALLGVAVVSGVFLFVQRRLLVGVSRHLEHRLRVDIYGHLLRLPSSFYMKERVGDLLTRLTSDVNAVRMATGPAFMYTISTGTLLIAATILMLRIDVRLTLLTLAIVPGVAAATRYFGSRIHTRWGEAQERLSHYTAHLQEHLVGMRVLRAYTCEDSERSIMQSRNRDYVAANARLISLQALFHPFLQALIGVSFVVVLGVGGNMVRSGAFTLGQFVEFNLYLVRLIWPMIAVGFVVNLVQRGSASMSRIEMLFAERPLPETFPAAPTHALPEGPASLELRDTTFTYPAAREPAVRDVTLTLRAGERIAAVGGVGSGKSTLLSLIPRILEPAAGMVFLDGRDVRGAALETLRRQVALVPQGSFLFSATLAENIALARPDAPADEIRRVALLAGLEEDLAELPKGLDTVVGERGVTLSGGQRQRVAIARALLTRPRLLLLDDCLSAVDPKTERAILATLPETSVLFATHRLAAAELCDRVLVLEHGRVVEEGTPADLTAAGGRYARLLALQRLEQLEVPQAAGAR